MKKCPYCAEEIQDEAIKCRFCGSMLAIAVSVEEKYPTGDTPRTPTPAPGHPLASRKSIGLLKEVLQTFAGKAISVVVAGAIGGALWWSDFRGAPDPSSRAGASATTGAAEQPTPLPSPQAELDRSLDDAIARVRENATRKSQLVPSANGEGPEGDEFLMVWAEAKPDEGPPPLSVQLKANISGSQGERKVKWDFGDNSPPSFEVNPTHTYEKSGTFRASVEVSDGAGDHDSDYVDIEVDDQRSVVAQSDKGTGTSRASVESESLDLGTVEVERQLGPCEIAGDCRAPNNDLVLRVRYTNTTYAPITVPVHVWCTSYDASHHELPGSPVRVFGVSPTAAIAVATTKKDGILPLSTLPLPPGFSTTRTLWVYRGPTAPRTIECGTYPPFRTTSSYEVLYPGTDQIRPGWGH